MLKCDATSRSTGQRCKMNVVPGTTKCRMHGGRSLSGPLSGRYKTGKYSRYAPAKLLDRYHEALADPELLSLRDSIALTTARISEVLANFDDAQPAEFWIQLQKKWVSFMAAVRRRDAKEQAAYLAEIDELVARGSSYGSMWNELDKAMEQQRKLVDAEQRRLLAANQMISVEEAMVTITQFVALVKDAVLELADQTTARVILTRINRHYQNVLNVPEIEVEYQDVTED